MKAKLGEKVWCIYDYQIILEEVEFLGEESFLIAGYQDKYDPEISYEDYNKVWFRDIEKAKKVMRKKYGRNIKFEKWEYGDLWEIVED